MGLVEYVSKKRGRNCLDKWSTIKLFFVSYMDQHYDFNYCRSGNIREVFIFANYARRTNSRMQESRENRLALLKKNEKLRERSFQLLQHLFK